MQKIITFTGLILLSIILTGCSVGTYEGLTAKEWSEKAKDYEYQIEDFKTALEEANNNIEEAQYYAGESYEEMEDALYYLSTVSEPY